MGNSNQVDACTFPIDPEAAAHIIFKAYCRHSAHDAWRHIRANALELQKIDILEDYFHGDRVLPWDRAGLKDDIRILRG